MRLKGLREVRPTGAEKCVVSVPMTPVGQVTCVTIRNEPLKEATEEGVSLGKKASDQEFDAPITQQMSLSLFDYLR
ncbi:hypothetical protein JTE90_004822 [Oedothorax gibbosus]|uniref:Uncharacterized protein n=1 Tax=Oedothorax gibbosus TaxID=931172 RepID=A0AAV6UQC5_9ARAC|nr:hypothetical protein JTE90_004822 [Oedothorax gibbosus]